MAGYLEYLAQQQEFIRQAQENVAELAKANEKIIALSLELDKAQNEIASLKSQIREPWEDKADKVISAALFADELNIPYKFGAEWINDKAFDCSSFMLKLALFMGIPQKDFGRGALEQSTRGTEVSYEDLRKADLMFFDTTGNRKINHVGMYIGDGRFIQTNTPTSGINIASVTPRSTWYKRLITIRRVFTL